jgi:heat shock protein HslJ
MTVYGLRMGKTTARVLTLVVIIAACGGGEASSPSPADSLTTVQSQSPVSAETTVPVEATTTTKQVQGVEAPELGGTSWLVGDYKSPDVGFTNVWIVEVTIAFSPDGTFSGSAGCNDYEGTWKASGLYEETTDVLDPSGGQVLVFESLTWTELACEDEDVMTQEEEILDILQNTGRWVLFEGNLNLRDSEGRFLLEASPA